MAEKQQKRFDAKKAIIGLGIIGAAGFFALKAFAGEKRREPQPGEQYPKAEIISITYASNDGKFTATVKVRNIGAARGQFFCEAFLVDADKCPPEWDGNYPVAVDLVRIGEGYRLRENSQDVPFRWLDPGAEIPDPFVMSATGLNRAGNRAGKYHLLIYVDVKNAQGEKIVGTNAGAARENVLEIKEGVKGEPRAKLGTRTYEGGSFFVLTGAARASLGRLVVAPTIVPIATARKVLLFPATGAIKPGASVNVTCTISNVGDENGDFKLMGYVYHSDGPAAGPSGGYYNAIKDYVDANLNVGVGAWFTSDWVRISAGSNMSVTAVTVSNTVRKAGTYRGWVIAAVRNLNGQRLTEREDYGYDPNAFVVEAAIAAGPKAQLGSRTYR